MLWLSFDIIAGKGEYFVTLFGKETNIILSICTVKVIARVPPLIVTAPSAETP